MEYLFAEKNGCVQQCTAEESGNCLREHKRTVYILTGILTGHCVIDSFAGMPQDDRSSYNDVQEFAEIGKIHLRGF